jgi:hypothetical protein
MRLGFAAFIGLVMQIGAPVQPPQILQIVREPLKPGSEAAYHTIEEDTARAAAALGCPHPYLGAESVTGSKEVWWFNGYESSAEQKRVYDDYARNARLMAALQQNSRRKAVLTLEPVEVSAHYRPELTVGNPWVLGRGRFLVITVTKSDRRTTGTVFDAPDGTRFIVTSAQTREQADAAKTLAGLESIILSVRPSWSFPAKDWIAADSAFWQLAHP